MAVRRQALHRQLAGIFETLHGFGSPVLELGCGHGHFLAAYAAANPQAACIGVDYCAERIRRATRKQEHAQLPNLRFVRAEAHEFIEELPDGVRFGRIFVLFPDPWPKHRHRKYRLLAPPFLERLAAAALPAPPAGLFFRTDSSDYFAEVCATLETHANWRVDPSRAWPFELATVFQKKAATFHSLAAVRIS